MEMRSGTAPSASRLCVCVRLGTEVIGFVIREQGLCTGASVVFMASFG